MKTMFLKAQGIQNKIIIQVKIHKHQRIIIIKIISLIGAQIKHRVCINIYLT